MYKNVRILLSWFLVSYIFRDRSMYFYVIKKHTKIHHNVSLCPNMVHFQTNVILYLSKMYTLNVTL